MNVSEASGQRGAGTLHGGAEGKPDVSCPSAVKRGRLFGRDSRGDDLV